MRIGTYENAFEAQAGCLHGASFGLGNRTDFSAEAHLSGKTDVGGNGIIEIGREYGADYGQIACGIRDAKTAYDTRLLRVNGDGFVDIYTIYKGYELEFVIAADGDLQDADVQMLVDFISDMDFIPAE